MYSLCTTFCNIFAPISGSQNSWQKHNIKSMNLEQTQINNTVQSWKWTWQLTTSYSVTLLWCFVDHCLVGDNAEILWNYCKVSCTIRTILTVITCLKLGVHITRELIIISLSISDKWSQSSLWGSTYSTCQLASVVYHWLHTQIKFQTAIKAHLSLWVPSPLPLPHWRPVVTEATPSTEGV